MVAPVRSEKQVPQDSGDSGGVSPPTARSKTALLAFTLPQTLQSQDVIIHADMISLKMV